VVDLLLEVELILLEEQETLLQFLQAKVIMVVPDITLALAEVRVEAVDHLPLAVPIPVQTLAQREALEQLHLFLEVALLMPEAAEV
jgi:hypothetical protein